jgi:hypothetical protein
MNTKKFEKKLVLNKRTVIDLQDQQMGAVHGGIKTDYTCGGYTCGTICDTYLSCGYTCLVTSCKTQCNSCPPTYCDTECGC